MNSLASACDYCHYNISNTQCPIKTKIKIYLSYYDINFLKLILKFKKVSHENIVKYHKNHYSEHDLMVRRISASTLISCQIKWLNKKSKSYLKYGFTDTEIDILAKMQNLGIFEYNDTSNYIFLHLICNSLMCNKEFNTKVVMMKKNSEMYEYIPFNKYPIYEKNKAPNSNVYCRSCFNFILLQLENITTKNMINSEIWKYQWVQQQWIQREILLNSVYKKMGKDLSSIVISYLPSFFNIDIISKP